MLLLVFVLVFAARVSYWASLEASPLSEWFRWKETDEHGYVEWSERIAKGNVLDVPAWRSYFSWQRDFGTPETWNERYPKNAYFTGPLYVYSLALLRVLFGSLILPARGLQLLLAALTSVVVAAATRSVLLGRVRAGVVFLGTLFSGVLYGLFAPLVFHDGFLYRDGPVAHVSTLLMVAPILLGGGLSPLGALGLGLFGGLALLLKQSLLPLVLGSLIVAGMSVESNARRRYCFLAAACGLGLALLPLIVRNQMAGVSPLTFDTRPAIGIAWGNVAGADASTDLPDEMLKVVDPARGSSLEAAKLVWRSYDGHRLDLPLLLARKLATFFNRYEVPDNSNFYFFSDRLPLLSLFPRFSLLLGPGLIGLIVAFRSRLLDARRGGLVALAFGTPLMACLMVQTVSRYRSAVAGPLAFGAGLGLALLIDRWPNPSSRRALSFGIFCAATLSAVTLAPSVIRTPKHRYSDALVAATLFEAREGGEAGIREIRRYVAEGTDDPYRAQGLLEARFWWEGFREDARVDPEGVAAPRNRYRPPVVPERFKPK